MINLYTYVKYNEDIRMGKWCFLIPFERDVYTYQDNEISNVDANTLALTSIVKGLNWIKSFYSEERNLTIYTDSPYILNTMIYNQKITRDIDLWKELKELLKDKYVMWEKLNNPDSNYYMQLCYELIDEEE